MLKTRARQITKCLRNNKHALACEQALHLGESQEITREPHAKGDADARGGERKDLCLSRGFAARSLARSLADRFARPLWHASDYDTR